MKAANKTLKTLIKIKDECLKHDGCTGCKHSKKVPDAIICGVHFDSHSGTAITGKFIQSHHVTGYFPV